MRSPDTQTERLEVIDNNRKDAVKKCGTQKRAPCIRLTNRKEFFFFLIIWTTTQDMTIFRLLAYI